MRVLLYNLSKQKVHRLSLEEGSVYIGLSVGFGWGIPDLSAKVSMKKMQQVQLEYYQRLSQYSL